MCAYNYYCGGGDTVTAGRPRVKAGDTILVHAGTYKYRRDLYTGDRTINATTPVEGTYYLGASGTPDKPIVIKGAGDGEVIFDGNGNFNLFNTKIANYNYFEGVTIRNTEIGIWAGTQFIAGSKGLTVKRCKFENVNLGIFTNYSGSSDFYIADNFTSLLCGTMQSISLDGMEPTGLNSREWTVRYFRQCWLRTPQSGSMARVTSSLTTTSPTFTMALTSRLTETRMVRTRSMARIIRRESIGTGARDCHRLLQQLHDELP